MGLLRDLHVSLSIVLEEQVLVFSICDAPLSQLGILDHLVIGLRLVVHGVFSEQHLLVVGVVKDIGIFTPSRSLTLSRVTMEAKSEDSHQGNELLRWQTLPCQAIRHTASIIGFGLVSNGLLFLLDLLSAHLEDHLGTSTVLHSGISTQLEDVWHRQSSLNVVALHAHLEESVEHQLQLSTLVDSSLILKVDETSGTTTENTSILSYYCKC